MSAPVTAEELASVDDLVRTLDSTEISEADLDLAIRRTIHLMPRLARVLTERTADRDALAAKIETMLRDEEDARALRIAEHAAREDVAGKLEALRAAVRAHHEAITAAHQMPGFARPTPAETAERLWTAAKA